MKKEFLTTKSGSITLNVTAGRIDSYRRKDETQNTVRVYEDGKIGIAGSLGEANPDKLTAEAAEALANGIPYPCALDTNKGELHTGREIVPQTEFLSSMQRLLDRLAVECPRFAISNKIKLAHFASTYRNSEGADLSASDSYLLLSLIFQNKGAGNLFDCAYGAQTRDYNEDAVVADCKKMHDAFYTPADIEPGEYPVFFIPGDILGTMLNPFVGELYASGASLLSGKLGQKIAAETFTLCDDRNPETNPGTCFFDDEGQVAPDYRQTLIKDGVLTNVLVSKNSSAMFGLPSAATSSSAYDGVPSVGFNGFYVKPTAESITQLAPGKAVLIGMASGGDMTPDGHFATPVQLAYLVENGEIVGKLPDIGIAGDFFDLIGKDYLGTVQGAFFPSMEASFMACKMQVSK